MEEKEEKSFPAEVILMTTSRNGIFDSLMSLQEFFSYLFGTSIYVHELGYLWPVAREHVLARYPQLAGLGEEITDKEYAKILLGEVKMALGLTLPIAPVSEEEYEYTDPISNLSDLMNGGVATYGSKKGKKNRR